MSKRKLKQPRGRARSRIAAVLATVGALVMSLGLVVLSGSTASASEQPCPDGIDGWTKVDAASGKVENQVWGDIWWGGQNGTTAQELKYDVEPGYTLDICIKSGDDISEDPADSKRVFFDDLIGSGTKSISKNISHIAYRAGQPPVQIPGAQGASPPTCDTAGSYTLPTDTDQIDWSISPAYEGIGTYEVKATTKHNLEFTDGTSEQTWTVVVLPATGDCPTRAVPTAPQPSAPDCDTDGSLTLPADTDDLEWAAVRDGETADAGDGPFGPGVYDITVTSTSDEFVGGGMSRTFENVTVLAATGDCTTSTTTTVSEERASCVNGLERRTGTVTTVNGQAQPTQWGSWGFVRALSNAEFEQLGCRPDQPEPVELLGAETRMDCAGVEERSSTQVTTFEWNETTREYEQVVGAVEWSDWVKVRNLTNKELRAEGCVLGEETLVPKPKPEQKPTVKGVERVAPPAAVPTAVAAGAAGGETSSSLTHLMAQMLLGGGMLLLLAGGWVGFGRRESGVHEA